MVRAKFKCTEVRANGEGKEIILAPVVGGDNPENDSFYNATPSGSIKLSTVNLAAAEKFEEGKEYYVDFTPAN